MGACCLSMDQEVIVPGSGYRSAIRIIMVEGHAVSGRSPTRVAVLNAANSAPA